MSSTGAGYDLSPTTFSPEGRIYQVEYATKAVEAAGTAIGIRCKDGIVLACEKPIAVKMLVPHSNKPIGNISKHAVMAVAGVIADGRQIINRAREECDYYSDTYGEPIPPELLNDRVSQYVHYFTLHGSLRPFGTAGLLAAYDEYKKTHELYMVEPSGMSYKYFGCAVGKGRQASKTEIEKLKLHDLDCRQALKEVAKILHKIHDEMKDKPFELEMSWLCEETNWTASAVPRDVINEAETWAKASIEAEDMDDSEDEDN